MIVGVELHAEDWLYRSRLEVLSRRGVEDGDAVQTSVRDDELTINGRPVKATA
jgi:hypothetical protein